MLCLVCGKADLRDLQHLAYHVKDSHGKEARRAYKRGKWVMATPASGQQPKSLFDAIDSLAEEQAIEDAAAIKGNVIAGQDAVASIRGAEASEGGTLPLLDASDKGGAPSEQPQPSSPVAYVVAASTAVYDKEQGYEVIPQPSFIEPKADLIVGATGSGKTINVGDIADYVLLKYGKLTRLASTDPSGAGPLQGKVKAGKIEFWAVHAWPRPIEAMYKSTLGYWPLRSDDPDSPLVPPDAGTFEVYGFGAFEGLTSYGDTILAELKRTKASLSQDPSYSWSQGDFSTSGGNQSYYGMMQDTLNQWVIKTHLLNYERVLWTALESRGKDKDGNTVYGPMIGGKQATGKAGQWFVNFFHMDIIAGEQTTDPLTKQTMVEAKHILFLKTHIDPLTMVPFPCKIRAPKEYAKEVPNYLASGSVADAYRLLDTLYEKQMKASVAELSEVAGLKERLMERAATAKKREQAEAEKRAKAASLLKPMVSVPAMPAMPIPATQVVQVRSAGSAGTVPPAVPKPAGLPAQVVPAGPLPAGIPTIQNVRKGK